MRNLLFAASIFGALFLPACGGNDDSGQLKVGVILPMTGDQSTYGEESWNGMLLAQDDLKQQGVEWELIRKDEKSLKQTAGNQAKLLIENEGVHVLLGSVASSNTLQMALVAEEAGVPLITPASTNARAMATDEVRSAGPSSMPGSRCRCRSIMERRCEGPGCRRWRPGPSAPPPRSAGARWGPSVDRIPPAGRGRRAGRD